MLKLVDNFLNYITIYKTVLYGLIILFIISLFLSFTNVLSYSLEELLLSISILVSTCYAANILLSKFFKAPVNVDSYLITAFILFFIMSPSNIQVLFWAALIAMVSKYLFVINKTHIFNPAAFSALFMGLFFGSGAVWWVGGETMFWYVTIIGLLVVRKMRRFNLFFSFLIASILSISFFGFSQGKDVVEFLIDIFKSWPIMFFATIMLTEPLTTPPTKNLQIFYGIIVGVLFGSQFQLGPIYATPELALVIGNIYSYFISPRKRLFLRLIEKIDINKNTFIFVFVPNKPLNFKPGQYLEWTLPHKKIDLRGSRRYFTLASSPTESRVQLGVKFAQKSSSFKNKLMSLEKNDEIVASHLAGDFVMPRDTNKKLVFIAGGIGITPFRSMIKYLLDKKEKRSIVLFYSNKDESEIVYRDVFKEAEKELGLKTIYILSDKDNVSALWKGRVGRIDEEMIRKEVPDYKERIFYLSGPIGMVDSYKKLLSKLNVKMGDIVTDYFPGF